MSRRPLTSATSSARPGLRIAGLLVALLSLTGTALASYGGASLHKTARSHRAATADVLGGKVLAAAKSHLGDAYVWGATGPRTWDCSGLTSTLWRSVGGVTSIPRTAHQQQAWAVPIPVTQALPGDLVFFGSPVTHVGIVDATSTSGGSTAVEMVDASSTQHEVVTRMVWHSDVVRYGRVPRAGMPPVTPWSGSAPSPAPTSKPSPSPRPAPEPSHPSRPAPSPSPVAAAPAVHGGVPVTVTAAHSPLPGLPAGQAHPSSAVARGAVTLALAAVGNTTLTDVGLVDNVWRRAGGGTLPVTRSALVARGHRVSLADLRVGDVVYYVTPGAHVGIYVGQGLLVDASASIGRVVQRQVWQASSYQVLRLPV